MENEGGRQYFVENLGIGLNNDQLKKDAKEAVDKLKGIGDSAVAEGARIDNAYKKAFEGVSKYGIGSKDELIKAIEQQKQAVAKLEEQYNRANAAFYNVKTPINPDTAFIEQQQKANKLLSDSKVELSREKVMLEQLEKSYEKLKEAISKSNAEQKPERVVSYRTQMMNLTDAMARMRDEGLKNTEEYRQLEEELKRVGTAYNEVAKEKKLLTTGRNDIVGIMSGITGISGVFTAAQGAASLFSKSNENLAAIQSKLQAAMSITIGLQAVSNTLHSTSEFRIKTVAQATELWRAAQTRLNTTLGISAGLSKALMIGGIGILLTGMTALVMWYKKWNKEQEETARLNKIVSDSLKETALEGEKSAKKETVSLEFLYKATQDVSRSQNERLKAAQALQKEYPSYFGNMSKEAILAGKASTAYDSLTNSIIKSAEARAKAKKIEENWDKIIDLEAKSKEMEAENIKLEAEAKRKQSISYVSQGTAGAFAYSGTSFGEASKINKNTEAISKNTKEREALIKANENLAKSISVDDLLFSTKENKQPNQPKKLQITKSKDYTDQIKREEQAILSAYENLGLTVEQARIDMMNEGTKKVLAQNELNYKKELTQIERQKEDLRNKLIELEKAKWLAKNTKKTEEDWNKSEEKKAVTLPESEVKKLTELGEKAREKWLTANKKSIDGLVKQYQTYAQKREDIEKKFNSDLADMYDENGNFIAGVTRANVDELNRQFTEALASLDNEFSRTKTSIEKLFEDMSRKSVSDMRKVANEAQAMMGFITNGEWNTDEAEKFGIKTEAQFKALNDEWSKSPEKLEAIIKAIFRLNDSADESETAFNKMSAGLKKMFSAKGQSELNAGLSMLSSGLKSVTEMSDLFSDSLRNIGKLSGSGIFTQLADGISSVMDAANKTMQGAQAGAAFGPIGAAVGAALGLVSSITGALAAGREQARINAELTRQILQQSYIGEKEINRLYRERYDWSRKIGETQLDYIKRVGEELKKQRQESEKDVIDYWEKLQNSQYYTKWDSGKRKGLGVDWLAKDVDAHWTDPKSLKGLSEKEIDILYYQGKLTDEAKAWYEMWLKAKDEQGNLIQKEEDELNRIRELFTGTTSESIVNNIVDGFKAGKRSAVDFADTFNSLMEDAVSNALSLLTDEKVKKFYEDFAKMAEDEDGLTKQDINYLQSMWDGIINGLTADAENLQKITGVTLGDSTREASQKGFASISQDSADELNGRFTAIQANTYLIQEHTSSISEDMKILTVNSGQILRHLAGIEGNTEFCRRLDGMDADLSSVKDDMRSVKSGIDDINLKGIRIKT